MVRESVSGLGGLLDRSIDLLCAGVGGIADRGINTPGLHKISRSPKGWLPRMY